MAMSIRGLPDDVKARLEHGAKAQGRSLNAHVVDILSSHARQGLGSCELIERFAGKSTWDEVLESRRAEAEDDLDWSMAGDDPSGQ